MIAGMDVVDRISAVETTTRYSYRDVPANPVVIHRAEVMPDPGGRGRGVIFNPAALGAGGARC